MNERIRELVEQAGFYVSANGAEVLIPDPHTEDITVVMKKFAELIVRECAKFSYAYTGNRKNVRDWDEHGWDCLPGDLQDAITKHFGVEE